MNEISKDRLERQLNDYLQKQTNYAIMLTASWGAGKTHYLNQKFFPQLSGSDYQGIIVSLFGVTSIDDIKDRIFFALFPVLENKYLKASGSILKLILKSVDISKLWSNGYIKTTIDDVEEAKKSLGEEKFDFVKLEKLLICFDDLERASPTMLEGSQILGFINSLVEDKNIKVIIVANEDKIDLGEIKEKTIGNTIHFQQNYEEVFEDIINSLQNPTDAYISHLRENKELVYSFLIRENNESINYRTFTYFLSQYAQICHYIQSGFKATDLNDKKKEILNNILRSCLMICIEFKKGKISFRNKHGLDNPVDFMLRKLYGAKGEEKPKLYGETIIDLYFPNGDFTYYDSIYSYLTGGDYFDTEKFYKELCKEYNVENDVISEPSKIFNQLSANRFKELSDAEHIKLLRQLRAFASKGEYAVLEYITVFFFIMRHGNVLNLNPQNLTDKFIRIMRKVQGKHTYTASLHQYYKPSPEGEFYDYSMQLFKVIEEINKNALIREEKKYDKEVEEGLQNNFKALFDKMIRDQRESFTRATLSGIRPLKLYQIFKKADNKKKSDIIMLLRIVYDAQSGNSTMQDFEFLTALEEILKANVSKVKQKNVSAALFGEFLNEVVSKREARRMYTYDL